MRSRVEQQEAVTATKQQEIFAKKRLLEESRLQQKEAQAREMAEKELAMRKQIEEFERTQSNLAEIKDKPKKTPKKRAKADKEFINDEDAANNDEDRSIYMQPLSEDEEEAQMSRPPTKRSKMTPSAKPGWVNWLDDN